MAILNVDEQLEIICEGTEEVIPLDELRAKIKRSIAEKKPLRVKLGLDPTAPDIHLGHTVVLKKLRQFQKLGHRAVLIIGDFTALVGDPSGKSEIRKPLNSKEIEANARTYTDQAFKILDSSPEKIEIVLNSEWLGKLSTKDILKLTSCYTVARMLQRDDFSSRYSSGKPISIAEFLYPLLQGMDSITIRADVELGGTDQKFNLLVGRELQKEYSQESQVIITTPLLEGVDGVQKMSKSLGNYIGVTEGPDEIFGKTMSIPDELMIRYYRLVSDATKAEVDEIERELKKGTLHPAKLKRDLARRIVALYHGKKKARKAEEEFDRIFKERQLPSEVSDVVLPLEAFKDGKVWVVRMLTVANLAKSSSEARRLIEQGGVKLNQVVLKDADINIEIKDGDLVQVGRRKFAKFRLS